MDISTLQQLYDKLFKMFGPQHWWPADTPFEVIIGAILTQNTSWKNVESAINKLKNCGLMTPERMYALPERELGLLIRSTGFYNQKSKQLKAFLEFLKFNHNNKIESMAQVDYSLLRRNLLSIYGIGDETADCILLYALNKPSFVVDAYTKRILNRIGFVDSDASYMSTKLLCESAFPNNIAVFNEFHALFVAFGKQYCKKLPLCTQCPFNSTCRYNNE